MGPARRSAGSAAARVRSEPSIGLRDTEGPPRVQTVTASGWAIDQSLGDPANRSGPRLTILDSEMSWSALQQEFERTNEGGTLSRACVPAFHAWETSTDAERAAFRSWSQSVGAERSTFTAWKAAERAPQASRRTAQTKAGMYH